MVFKLEKSLVLDVTKFAIAAKKIIAADVQPHDEEEFHVRSTIFSLGKDPRVSAKPTFSAPELMLGELLRDGLDNPMVKLQWQFSRESFDANGIVGFNVWKKRMSESAIPDTNIPFDRSELDRLAWKSIRKGKFSEEKKAIYNVRRGLITMDVLNNNLNLEQASGRSRFQSNLSSLEPILLQSQHQTIRKSEKIAFINYSKFLAKEKNNFVNVIDRNFIFMHYEDKKVGYGEIFEYQITAVSKNGEQTPKSNAVKIPILDLSGIRAPSSMHIKQNDGVIHLTVSIDPRDNVSRALVYRRSEDDIFFSRIGEIKNVNNESVHFVDNLHKFLKSYFYRVFLVNVFGTISEPKEIEVVPMIKNILPKSRFNDLKTPIASAEYLQEGSVKITISPNDPRINFYDLRRRDLTINEKRFSVPCKVETNYGADGWTSNQFINEKQLEQIGDASTQFISKEIVFVDDTTSPNHHYEYKVEGVDIYGNRTSSKFISVRLKDQKKMRSPINFRYDVVRESPFRINLSWEDDNFATSYSQEELLQGASTTDKIPKVLYRVQRRKQGENVYETFPLTANKYLIDEVSSGNSLVFDNRIAERPPSPPSSDTGSRVPAPPPAPVSSTDSRTAPPPPNPQRPFGVPKFLQKNSIYFYRITVVDPIRGESEYTKEIKAFIMPAITMATNLKASIDEPRVRPILANIRWESQSEKSPPDYWIIERKVDTSNEDFAVVGKAFFKSEFTDRGIQPGKTYAYRIKAIDALGRESIYNNVRLRI